MKWIYQYSQTRGSNTGIVEYYIQYTVMVVGIVVASLYLESVLVMTPSTDFSTRGHDIHWSVEMA